MGALRGGRLVALALVAGAVVGGVALPGAPVVAASSRAAPHLVVGDCRGAGGYASIQDAVDAVHRPNRVIEVCPGSYFENVTVSGKRRLVVVGLRDSTGASVVGRGDDAFTVRDSRNVRLEQLGVESARAAVRVVRSPGTTARDLAVADSEVGVAVGAGSTGTWVVDNDLGSVDVGISMTGVHHVRVQGNRMGARGTGIRLVHVDDAKVRRNDTSEGGLGLVLRDSHRVRVRHHTADRNDEAGIRIDGRSGRNRIERSRLRDNGIDAVDESDGDRTAGTDDTWTGVTCATSDPVGLCVAG